MEIFQLSSLPPSLFSQGRNDTKSNKENLCIQCKSFTFSESSHAILSFSWHDRNLFSTTFSSNRKWFFSGFLPDYMAGLGVLRC